MYHLTITGTYLNLVLLVLIPIMEAKPYVLFFLISLDETTSLL